MYYPTLDTESPKLVMKLEAELYNNSKEQTIFTTVANFAEQYTGQFNKRFETYLNAAMAQEFGVWHYQDRNPGVAWNSEEPNKAFNNVTVWFSKASYGGGYELGIHYNGKEIGYDYDTKQTVMRDRNQSEKFYSLKDSKHTAEQLRARVDGLKQSELKLKDNKKNLKKLIAERNKIGEMLSAYNDKIVYALSDDLRLK